jgi:regulator of protease activity HflC (stomatin/prohibitin superfamily)
MADITRALLWRHYRGSTAVHVVQMRRGRTVRSGTGLAFWFRSLTAALSEVPVDERELPLLFHARTRDHQDVTVQATIGYRVEDAERAAGRLDFSIDPDTGRWQAEPLEQVALLLTESAQQHALDLLAARALAEALTALEAVRARISTGLAADDRLAQLGIGIVSVRVVAVRPEPEVERALQTPARELVQQEADRATYERRALAVERERAISENELQSRIELATREEQLVVRQGANTRRRAAEAAAAERIEAEAGAERDRLRSTVQAEGVRLLGEAEADAARARMVAYTGVDPRVLLALAAREAAGNLPEIGSLTLAPDLLTTVLGSLAGGERP